MQARICFDVLQAHRKARPGVSKHIQQLYSQIFGPGAEHFVQGSGSFYLSLLFPFGKSEEECNDSCDRPLLFRLQSFRCGIAVRPFFVLVNSSDTD